jgi:outer membrane protein OmpA-like peptidoglycan-associated protein
MKKRLVLLLSFTLFIGCASEKNNENQNRNKGAGIGAAAGAIVGGIIGNQSGNRNRGAMIGAALGGSIGGVAGARMDKQAKELQRVAETKRTDQGLVTKLKNDILFDTGKSDLKPQALNNIKQMAAIMKKYPENILTINGYTDSTGTQEINEELSLKRAEAVKSALVANGLPSDTISVQGKGPADPVADNTTATGRMKNRRVEIQVTVDESKIPKNQKSASK